MDQKVHKKIPIGIGSYKRIKMDGYYYVDKTRHIEILERLDTVYPVLLRPRRFGKTLFADMLGAYYDIKERDNFEQLFGDTYIGQHKTSLANSYYVLHFDFSGLNTENIESLKQSFSENIKETIRQFLRYYELTEVVLSDTEHFVSYTNSFLTRLGSYISDNLYIIIDEYDHFANAMLSDTESFTQTVDKDGFVRSFYEVLKRHTKDVLARIFITGVTPLTLDSLTSGFNITDNITDYTSFNDALGFTFGEVKEFIKYMNSQYEDLIDEEETLRVFKEYYNGYLFSADAKERIYNSNMILFYMNSYINRGKPFQLADPNITGDYTKLVSMFDLYDDAPGRERVLQKLMNNERVQGNLVTSFSLLTNFTYDHFISLLYYLGLLTVLGRAENGGYEFRIPNKVIRDVYYDYYYTYLTKHFDITDKMIMEALEVLEDERDISAVIQLTEQIIAEFTKDNNRYLVHFRENSLHTFFYLMLRKSRRYQAKMEYQADLSGKKKYIDILYKTSDEDRPSYAIELKYITPARYEADHEVLTSAASEADEQIRQDLEYLKSEDLEMNNYAGISIVFVGKNCKYHTLTGGTEHE